MLICISSILKICTGITAFWKVLYMYIIIYLSFECIYLLQIHVYPFSIVICIYGYKSCCLYICEFSQMANCKYIRFILHVCLNPVMFRQSRFLSLLFHFQFYFSICYFILVLLKSERIHSQWENPSVSVLPTLYCGQQ